MRLSHDDAYQLAREEQVAEEYEATQKMLRAFASEWICALCGKHSSDSKELCLPRRKQ